jgi:hypothetical protein
MPGGDFALSCARPRITERVQGRAKFGQLTNCGRVLIVLAKIPLHALEVLGQSRDNVRGYSAKGLNEDMAIRFIRSAGVPPL